MNKAMCKLVAFVLYWGATLTSLFTAAAIITWWPAGIAFAGILGVFGFIATVGYNMPMAGTLADPISDTLYEISISVDKDDE